MSQELVGLRCPGIQLKDTPARISSVHSVPRSGLLKERIQVGKRVAAQSAFTATAVFGEKCKTRIFVKRVSDLGQTLEVCLIPIVQEQVRCGLTYQGYAAWCVNDKPSEARRGANTHVRFIRLLERTAPHSRSTAYRDDGSHEIHEAKSCNPQVAR